MTLPAGTTDPRKPKRTFWIDLLVILAGVALVGSIAGWRMTHHAIWGDEVRTWRDGVGKRYADILQWKHNADHAPLGHLLTKASSDVFDTQSPWALRLPAYLFGLAIVPLGYLLGRLAHGRVAAILIVTMVSVDLTVITQAHQARMYTQFLAWTLSALCCAAWLLRSPERPCHILENVAGSNGQGTWLLVRASLLGLLLAMALWTHYAAMSLLIATVLAGVVLLFGRDDRRQAVALLVGVGVACLISIQGLIKLIGMRGRDALPGAGDEHAIEQLLLAGKGLMGSAPLCVMLFLLAAGGLYLLYAGQRRFAVVLTLSVVVGVANLLVASLYRQIEGPRYLLGFLPACWVGLAVLNATFLQHRWRWVRLAVGVLFVIGVSYQLFRTITATPHPLSEPLREVASALPGLGFTPGQTIVFAPSDPLQMPGRYYGLRHDTKLHGRILASMKLNQATPQTLGRARPDELWMILSTSCRKSQRGTPQDGVRTAITAAGLYGQTLDPSRVPYTPDVNGELRILRLTPNSIDIWDAKAPDEPRTK